jgi:hypothetical protein
MNTASAASAGLVGGAGLAGALCLLPAFAVVMQAIKRMQQAIRGNIGGMTQSIN